MTVILWICLWGHPTVSSTAARWYEQTNKQARLKIRRQRGTHWLLRCRSAQMSSKRPRSRGWWTQQCSRWGRKQDEQLKKNKKNMCQLQQHPVFDHPIVYPGHLTNMSSLSLQKCGLCHLVVIRVRVSVHTLHLNTQTLWKIAVNLQFYWIYTPHCRLS